jgi:hypothetical protein
MLADGAAGAAPYAGACGALLEARFEVELLFDLELNGHQLVFDPLVLEQPVRPNARQTMIAARAMEVCITFPRK